MLERDFFYWFYFVFLNQFMDVLSREIDSLKFLGDFLVFLCQK